MDATTVTYMVSYEIDDSTVRDGFRRYLEKDMDATMLVESTCILKFHPDECEWLSSRCAQKIKDLGGSIGDTGVVVMEVKDWEGWTKRS